MPPRRIKPPSELSPQALNKLLKKYSIRLSHQKGHHYHYKGRRRQDGKPKIYSISADSTRHKIYKIYVDALRKEFGISRDEGVSDDEFYSR